MKKANAPVSASEISAYRQCPRVWAARYRWEDWPVNRGTGMFVLGSAYHRVVERYLAEGVLPSDASDPITEMFMTALPYLPRPMVGLAIEEKDTFVVDDIPYEVTPDVLGDDARFPGVRTIWDHKTSKDPARYGVKSRDEKLDDTQTVLYSFRYLRPEGVVFNHLYTTKHRAAAAKYETQDPDKIKYFRATPNTFETPIHLSQKEVTEAFRTKVHPVAEKVFQLRNKHERIDPATLPKATNPDEACQAYGGCPHMDRCWPQGFFGGSGADGDPFADTAVAGPAVLLKSLNELLAVKPTQAITLAPLIGELEQIVVKLRKLC